MDEQMCLDLKHLDCGIEIFPFTKELFKRFAKIKWFLIVACLTVIAQEICVSYFTVTAHIWREEYGFSERAANWLIISNQIFQGLFASFIVHLSNKRHRAKWMAGPLAFLAVTSTTLILSELAHPLEQYKNDPLIEKLESMQLCHHSTLAVQRAEDLPCYNTLIVMYLFQLTLGASISSIHINSIIYIDDHVDPKTSVTFIGILLACKQVGSHFGVYFSWITLATKGAYVFGTTAFGIVICIIYIISGALAMYPKYLDDTTMVKVTYLNKEIGFDTGLFPSLCRTIKNKLLMLNILSQMFLWAALENFQSLENDLIQTKFFVSNQIIFHNSWISQILTSSLRPLLGFFTVLLTGYIFAKFSVKAKCIAIWNVIIPLLLIVIYFVYMNLGCGESIMSEVEKRIVSPYCSYQCNCQNVKFDPVCLESLQNIYFSPCHAGCTSFQVINGSKIFTNCSCAIGKIEDVKEGGCLMLDATCNYHWIIMQVLRIVVSTLVSSQVVGHIMLSMRIVKFTDRSYALAMESIFVGFFSYVIGKLIYQALSDKTCQYYGMNAECTLHSTSDFTLYIYTATIVLLMLSVIEAAAVASAGNKIDLYTLKEFSEGKAPPKEEVEEAEAADPEPLIKTIDTTYRHSGERATPDEHVVLRETAI